MGRRPAPPSRPPSPPSPSSDLPLELSSFVGRDREVAEVESLLGSARLVTLTGAGGSGKTRLAGEVARRETARRRVIWVGLASLDDADLLVHHVAASAGVPAEPRTVEGLVPILGTEPLLLVLDNCEHLVDACADLAGGLLRAAPGLGVLATSREVLGVRGERAWLVPPLGLPEPGAPPDAAADAAAVRLFVERAREAVADFTPGPDDLTAIADICRTLDGIPLAIELAAARIRILTPAQIRDRLGNALDLLAAGGRGVLPRHRTLRAAIDWSHDLLAPAGRRLLRRLAVFRGGASLEATEEVGYEAGDDVPTLEVLGSLVDRSLVTVETHDGLARYGLLETVRQYAGEQLEASGESMEVRRRHARHFCRLAAEAEDRLLDVERPEWVTRLGVELDNLRETLHWTRDHEPEEHVRLVGRLWWFWYSTRHWTEARRWLDEALALPEAAEGRDRAALLFARGALSALQARAGEARPFLEEAVQGAAAAGDGRLEAYARNYLGMTYAGEGRAEAADLCRQAEAWFRAHDDLYGLRLALLLQGSLAMGRGQLDESVRLNREGVEVARRFGLERELAVSLQNLAAAHLTAGEHREAGQLVREALEASRRDPSHFFVSTGLSYLAEALGHGGHPLLAARYLGAAEGLADTVGAVFFPLDRNRREAALPGFRQAVGDDAFEAARQEGRRLGLEEVLAEVAALPPVASLQVDPPAPGPARPAPAPAPDPADPVPPADLDVRLLGGFEVRVRGAAVPGERWSYAKPRELLAHLVGRPDGAARDRLAGQLWSDAPDDGLKNRFHVTLHHLRKALGESGWVELVDDRYRIRPDVTLEVDATRFEEAARTALSAARAHGPDRGGGGRRGGADRGDQVDAAGVAADLRSALTLYRGDLLEGDAVGAGLEEWRDRLRGLALDLHLALGALHEAAGDAAAAVASYGAAAGYEPLSEEAHRGLMRAWTATGERARAAAHYARVRELLHQQLGVEPDPDTSALAEELGLRGTG